MLGSAVRVIAGLGCWLVCACAAAQDVRRLQQVADLLARDHHFTGTVLVAKAERVLLDRAYGKANVEWAVPNRRNTRFRLGSVTKQFTAASVLLLQDRGKLELNDAIGQHLPDLPPAWRPVTVQQLLSHTSGIHSFTDLPEYSRLQRLPHAPGEVLNGVRARPLDFAPGSQFDYSNSNYVLLGMLIEKLTGESYAEFVQKHIFKPLGMTDSGYDTNAAIIPRRAAGYREGRRQGLSPASYIDMSVPYAAGTLYSTTGDLLRWQRALYGGQLLSPGSLKAMLTPVRNEYAFGLVVNDGPDGQQIGHGGSIEGFSTLVGYRPKERISVILLSNIEGRDLSSMERTLFQAARGRPVRMPSERRAVALAPERARQIVGTYATQEGVRFRIRLENGQLSARLGSQAWLPIFAEASDKFFARTVDTQLDISRSETGAVAGLTLVQDGQPLRMQRIAGTGPDFQGVPFFVRGEMNDWGTSAPMRRIDAHTFQATLTLAQRRYAFKFGSDDFTSIDIGAFDGRELAAVGAPLPLEENGQNVQVDIPTPGAYQFTLDTTDVRVPRVTVTYAAGAQ